MADDRRASIEAAFSEEEKEEVVETPAAPVAEVDPQLPLDLEDAPTEVAEKPEVKEETAEPVEAKSSPTDRAPQSWKPAEKAKWATIDPDVKQEIYRREREVTKTLSETAAARQLQ